jgi:hypothetical protein
MQALKQMEQQVQATPDKQVSLTDPDARSTATSGRGSGMVGYNVQTAVDAENHLIVAHEVTNLGHDRTHVESMGLKAQAATGCVADHRPGWLIPDVTQSWTFSGDRTAVVICEYRVGRTRDRWPERVCCGVQ